MFEFFKENKKILLFVVFMSITLIVFTSTFSEDTTSSAWDGTIATSFASGNGSSDNPYKITDGSELAYMQKILNYKESAYKDKYFVLTKSINMGNREFGSLGSFSGILNGDGHSIYNFKQTEGSFYGLFKELDGATIKNLNVNSFAITPDENFKSFGVITSSSKDTTFINVSISDVNVNLENGTTEENVFTSGFVGEDNGNNDLDKVFINFDYENTGSVDVYQLFGLYDDSSFDDIIIGYKHSYVDEFKIVNNTSVDVSDVTTYQILNGAIYGGISTDNLLTDLNDNNNNYRWYLDDTVFKVEQRPTVEEEEEEEESSSGTSLVGQTVTINDLKADYNYYKGLNYTGVWNNTGIPSGTSTNYFDDNKLVKAEIIYDGRDLNNSNLVGAVSPISGENNYSNYHYYKYFPFARDKNGNLLTDSNGHNYIHIELIDNPYSKRPIDSSHVEYGFNGWVCNQDSDTTNGLCSSSTFKYDDNYYTRYLDVPVSVGNDIKIHLNASWIPADVKSSTDSSTNDFEDKGMKQAVYAKTITETLDGTYYTWKDNYYTFTYSRTITNRGYTDAGEWYYETQGSQPAPNGNFTLTYSSTAYGHRCARNYTCYVYTATRNGVTANSIYNVGDVIAAAATYPTSLRNGTTVSVRFLNQYYSTLMNTRTGQHQVTHDIEVSMLSGVPTAGGFYYQVSNPTAAMVNTGNYYNADGTICTNRTSCTTAYKLIQFNDATNKSNGNSIYNVQSNGTYTVVDQAKYYYLVTRDVNIFKLNGSVNANTYTSSTSSKPYTLTGYNGTNIVGTINVSSGGNWPTYYNFTAYDDITIENIKFSGFSNAGGSDLGVGDVSFANGVIYANSQNLKIGRNITNSSDSDYIVANSIVGGSSNAISGGFKVIVEAGHFNGYTSGTGASNGGTFNEITVFGSDFDRSKKENTKLWFNLGLEGYYHGDNIAGNDSLYASFNNVKSGTFGYNANGDPSSDNNAGLYITARAGHYVRSLTGAKIDGGNINNVVGAYGFGTTANNSETTYQKNNCSLITMTGGNVRIIYGGAGTSATYGNRIISVTGGNVEYSVLGGSNSYTGSSTDGKLTSDTLVYIGGNAVIGTEAHISNGDTLYNVESGSVFGAGGGRSGSSYTGLGTVYNSHVIINGGTIHGSVYGGGNYGSTGTQLSATSRTTVDVYDGKIINSVFGGSKASGFSKSDYIGSSAITINVHDGKIGNIYGGSDSSGICYGSTTINLYNGEVTGNVYGGGKGGYASTTDTGTFVAGNSIVNIGSNDEDSDPKILGSIYGGSAFGTVNGSSTSGNSSYTTQVTVNSGTVEGSVYGGGEGNSSYTPHVLGDITVDINGGNIGKVFGGFNAAGTPSKGDVVYLDGGVIGSAFGGGNNTGVTTTNINLRGATVTEIFGGSNASGNVTTSNVNISSGEASYVYGGNNVGGEVTTSNITINGAAIKHEVYGGGNAADVTTSNVNLNAASNTIPEVYGGGKSANVGTSNVNLNGANAGEVFGGSNTAGVVTTSYVDINAGNFTYVYGGNNMGGSTTSSNITATGGTVSESIFGGGNEAETGTSNIDITSLDAKVKNIFGGGNEASVDTTNVEISSVIADNVYGASNNSGDVEEVNLIVNSGTITHIYGGGNKAAAMDIDVTVNGGTITDVFGGGNEAGVDNVNLKFTGGTINDNIYGGGNFGTVSGNILVDVKDTRIMGSAYAGGNGATAIVDGNTTINVHGNTIIGTENSPVVTNGSVFGGGNAAPTGAAEDDNSIATVNIASGYLYGNVYGGANTSVVNGETITNVGKNLCPNTLTSGDIYVGGTVFGGGEANASGSEVYDWNFISVTKAIEVNINGAGHDNFTIAKSIFGSGNASSTSGTSVVNIDNYGTATDVKKNISIQRTNVLNIRNSYFELAGATDRANEYSDVLFSLSRIDDLKLANNSSLYLKEGANLLKKYESLLMTSNGDTYSETKEVVTIDEDTGEVTKNVNNRLYMYEGKHLNITTNENATSYGEVNGMTFFGMYVYDRNGAPKTGLYDKSYDDTNNIPSGDLYLFTKGSYVLGQHMTNHDIEEDGFYSKFNDAGTVTNNYIIPTPESSNFYMWVIGEVVTEYNVNLTASKYSTLGSVELPLLEFASGNVQFQVLGFNYNNLVEGASLVDPKDIPRVASTSTDADNIMGISMESSNSGWSVGGKTIYKTNSSGVSGTIDYKSENSTDVPNLLFYLYHSKNLSSSGNMGTVSISLMAISRVDDLTNEAKRIVINVNLSRALYTTNDYEGAITAGRKYEMFSSTTTNITSKSSVSAYFSLYEESQNSIYKTGYHRSIVSDFVFPLGTQITLIDLSSSELDYYYHVINSSDVTNATTEYTRYGEASYEFSDFVRMGSSNSNNRYDNATKNGLYYDSGVANEEFIVIVDYSNANISADSMNNSLLMELRDSDNQVIKGVLGMQQVQMVYNIYHDKDATINLNGTLDSNEIYSGQINNMVVTTDFTQKKAGSDTIYDTYYFDKQLGIRITIVDENENQLSGTSILGLYYELDGVKYYPTLSGDARINISNKIANTLSRIKINATNANIATNNYKIKIESFASPDGIYYGDGVSEVLLIPIKFINKVYGLKATIADENVIIDKETGKTVGGNDAVIVGVNYTSRLEHPKMSITLNRRLYDDVYSSDYELVDLKDYVSNSLTSFGTNENEYLIANNPTSNTNFFLNFNSGIETGTYKILIKLYDNNIFIGEVEKYIIVKEDK